MTGGQSPQNENSKWYIFEHAQNIGRRILTKAKTGFTDTDLDVLIEILKLRIKAIPLHEFSEFISKAESICKDAKDLPYFALALKQKCPLWSGDKALKEQSTIIVFNTKELVERFGL